MAQEFRLPDIGEGLTEATVLHWYVEVGDPVDMDAPLVEVETDKAAVDIPSPFAGVLLHRGGEPGATIAVGDVLAVVGETGESWSPTTSSPDPAEAESGAAAPIVGSIDTAPEVIAAPATPRALPAVRKLARELGVDLAAVSGTGPGGRITEADVRAAATSSERGPVERVPMSPRRRTIAAHLSRSWREIPHVTTFAEADAGWLLRRRTELGKPPLEALVVSLVVPALQRHPDFNAVVEGDTVVRRRYYDVGIAVDAPEGLTVAVIRDADAKSVAELADEITRLAGAVRDRTVTPDEVRGATFTISNIGAVGGGFGTPIVPWGTTAILSLGRAEPKPVVRVGEITIRTMLPLSLSYDHRAIDGAAGRAFMADVVASLEGKVR